MNNDNKLGNNKLVHRSYRNYVISIMHILLLLRLYIRYIVYVQICSIVVLQTTFNFYRYLYGYTDR